MMGEPKAMSNSEIDTEITSIESAWDDMIIERQFEAAQERFGPRLHALRVEREERRMHSSKAVVRLRFLAGESGRELDAACAEALGWRVGRDPWWNWHPGPVFDPPGDEWCIRKDGRNDIPCNEALPHFTAEMFERLSRP